MKYTIRILRKLGFDKTEAYRDNSIGRTRYHIRCSQCQAMTIQGMPTHERGCRNAPKG